MIHREDTGFVNFPQNLQNIKKLDAGKTLVYIVAFDILNSKNNLFQNIKLLMPGIFVSDDIIQRPSDKNIQLSIDELITDQQDHDAYDSLYFPNLKSTDETIKNMSIPITSCVLVGWADFTYEVKDELGFWFASFRDLTNEGKKLYYSFKKLHYDKEIRILTFNNI